ncbi:MAG: hypothetical protein M3010_12225, partial [Candidatus Dormibacteraeota bacterium]|nr:hypothetical protein [Candidatus Dormibacteraeota bacterium]
MEHTSLTLFGVAIGAYFVSMPLYFIAAGFGRPRIFQLALAITGVGLLAHLGSFGYRWAADGHYPLSNMYEYSSLMALVMVGFFVATARSWRTEFIGGLVLIGAIGIMSV